jgi:uncharacterized membrane protein YagU involved in acid resistance
VITVAEPLATSTETGIIKGAAAGLLGGIVAAWAMNRFYTIEDWLEGRAGCGRRPEQRGLEPEAVAMASAAAHILGRGLSETETRVAAQAVHYGVAGLLGTVYGALAAIDRRAAVGMGTGFGLGVWLLADKIALPLAGLSPVPKPTPLAANLFSIGSHLAYGVVLERVRSWLMATPSALSSGAKS